MNDQYFDYLDKLRASGKTNMFGAAPFLQANFGLGKREATNILMEWMRTFADTYDRRELARLQEKVTP
jgi:hypothetical protein